MCISHARNSWRLSRTTVGGWSDSPGAGSCGFQYSHDRVKDGHMLIMAIHQVPSLTRERYEEVIRKLTNGKRRLESLSDRLLPGPPGAFRRTGQERFLHR